MFRLNKHPTVMDEVMVRGNFEQTDAGLEDYWVMEDVVFLENGDGLGGGDEVTCSGEKWWGKGDGLDGRGSGDGLDGFHVLSWSGYIVRIYTWYCQNICYQSLLSQSIVSSEFTH